MGKFACMPAAIIAMLVRFVDRSHLCLARHLAHENERPKTVVQMIFYGFGLLIRPFDLFFSWLSKYCNGALDWFGEMFYGRLLRIALKYPLLLLQQ